MATKNTTSRKGQKTPHDTPHDTLVREHFQHPENALGLIRAGLPPEVFAELDTSTLRHKGIHLSTTALLKSVTDLLFTCSLQDGSDAFVHIVLEHKSNPDALVAVQILKYMALIWDHYRRKHPKNTRLPFIIPLIFYHGQAKWEPRPLRSLFPQNSPLLAYVPQFDLSICNLHNVDEDQLRQDVFHNAMLLLLKAIIEKESLPHIAHTLQLIQSAYSGAAIVDILELFFNYLAQIRPEITIDAIDEELAKLPEGGTMSQLWQERWAEYSYKQGAIFGRQEGWKLGSQEGWQKGSQEGWQKGKQEGKQEGRQEGKQEGIMLGEAKGACNALLSLLASQFSIVPIGFVQKLRNITDTTVLFHLTTCAPKAESLEAFEALVDKTLGVPQS